jgi:hypothetical protein
MMDRSFPEFAVRFTLFVYTLPCAFGNNANQTLKFQQHNTVMCVYYHVWIGCIWLIRASDGPYDFDIQIWVSCFKKMNVL